MSTPSQTVLSLLAAALVVAACADGRESASDDSVAGSAADTGMAGMDHSRMPGTNRAPAKDADHEFLRMMSDHHEGMIVMMGAAMERATSATAKADARKLHDKQRQERDSMVALIRTVYNDSITPMVMPGAKAMNDSLQQKTGAAYDRDMYRHVIMHHQEGVRMVDDFLPRLQRAEVRQMAEKMRADQQREIEEFQRKQTG
jgi:uncharacterized protein (DUF305 family)